MDPRIVTALAEVGIIRAFAIQAMALPIALAGSDLIGQARTGTGKTLSFGVPLIQRNERTGDDDGRPLALVVVPTRELAMQVTRDLTLAGRPLNTRCLAIYGGRAYEPQISTLRSGVDVVVGTPGRLLDLATQGHLRLGAVRTLVLDEADEMLDLGFLPDVERILAMVPDDRHTMLFSATMPGPIVALARRFMRQPTQIRAEAHDETSTLPPVGQYAYRAHALDKVEMLARLLQATDRGLTMVFCRTKRTAAKVADELESRGFAAAAVHGDLGQSARERALRAFRSGKVDVLVATDVAARGIDVEAVTHVVNYQCPEDEKVYLHRVGRTGRAGATGTAVTFVDWDEVPRWSGIATALDLAPELREPVETYSTSEHFHADLGIPAEATGTLPRAARVRAGLRAEAVEDIGETGHARRPRRPRSRRGGAEAGPRRGERGTGSGDPDGSTRVTPRTRNRRRTRGGRPVESTGTAETGTASAGPGGDPPAEDARPERSRRRNRRGGRGRRRGGAGTGTRDAAPSTGGTGTGAAD